MEFKTFTNLHKTNIKQVQFHCILFILYLFNIHNITNNKRIFKLILIEPKKLIWLLENFWPRFHMEVSAHTAFSAMSRGLIEVALTVVPPVPEPLETLATVPVPLKLVPPTRVVVVVSLTVDSLFRYWWAGWLYRLSWRQVRGVRGISARNMWNFAF